MIIMLCYGKWIPYHCVFSGTPFLPKNSLYLSKNSFFSSSVQGPFLIESLNVAEWQFKNERIIILIQLWKKIHN